MHNPRLRAGAQPGRHPERNDAEKTVDLGGRDVAALESGKLGPEGPQNGKERLLETIVLWRWVELRSQPTHLYDKIQQAGFGVRR